MKLVDRHTHETIRDLPETEKRALVDFYAKSESEYLTTAIELIASSRNAGQYFVCDCVPFQPASPTLSTRHISQGSYALVNLPGRQPHAFNCPFSYSPSENKDKQRIGYQHEIEKIVYIENSLIHVNEDQLTNLYRSLITNTQLNRLTYSTDTDPDLFRSKLVDGCRLTPSLVKQGISKKIRFGLEQYSSVVKEIKTDNQIEWLILVSMIEGTDGQNLFRGDILGSHYKIPAGRIVSMPSITFGPMVATTIIATRGKHVFSLATAIDSVYLPEIPIVVSCHEDRIILNDLIGSGSLLEWVDKKQPSDKDEKSFVEVNCLPTVAPITKTKTLPRMTLFKQGVRLLVADPSKLTREAYDEQGIVLWHRSFSHIPSVFKSEFKQFKSKIAAILLKSDPP